MDDRTRHEHFPKTALGHEGQYICTDRPQFEKKHQSVTPQKKKGPRLAKRRKSEEAKGRPSHIGRAILSQRACLTYDLSQLIIRNMRLTHTRSSDGEHLVVSRWSKFKHMFSHSVSGIVNVEDLCSNIERGHNESTFNITFREESSCSFLFF